MTKEITLENISEHLEDLIADVRTHGGSVIIRHGDQPVAVLLSENEYATLKQLEKNAALQDLGALLDQVHSRNAHFAEEEVARDVLEAYHEGRQGAVSK